MTDTQESKQPEAVAPGLLKKLADLYGRSELAYFLRVLEPLGIFLAIAGVWFTLLGLFLSRQEIELSRTTLEQNQRVHSATLTVMLMERLEKARALDSKKYATLESSSQTWECKDPTELTAQAGQIQVLEIMNKEKIPLVSLVANSVNLVVPQDEDSELYGIKLEGAKLEKAVLINSNLQKANLKGAILKGAYLDKSCLKDAVLIGAELQNAVARRVDFSGADLTGAKLNNADLSYALFRKTDFKGVDITNADITGAHFEEVKNLDEETFNKVACIDKSEPRPSIVPKNPNLTITICPTEDTEKPKLDYKLDYYCPDRDKVSLVERCIPL